MFKVDLADFQQLAKENDGYRYLLVGVDVLSRRCFAVPVKSKSSEDMQKGFEELFKQMPNLASEIYSDNGREFCSNEMRKYFEEKGISQFFSQRGEQKAAVAERFIRTIKDRLYRYFSEKNTTRYLEAIPKIVEGLNNTVNSATGIAPNNVTPEMTKELWNRLYKDSLLPAQIMPKKPRYKAGDAVRMSKGKRIFDKRSDKKITEDSISQILFSYWPRYTDEIFKVKHVIKGTPNYYTLEDQTLEPILGRLYEEELSKTRLDKDTSYRIEKILEERRDRLLVKFIGYPKPEWISRDKLLQ